MKAPIHGAMALLSALPLGWAPAVLAQATGDVSTGTPAVLTDLDRVFAEVRIGVGSVAPASTVKVTPSEVAAVSVSPLTATVDPRSRATPDAAAAYGATLGTWFSFLGAWAKNLGVSFDYSHQNLGLGSSPGSYSEVLSSPGQQDINLSGDSTLHSIGSLDSVGILLKIRHGWLADGEAPDGKLKLEVGVGPSVNFASQKAVVRFDNVRLVNGVPEFTSLGDQRNLGWSSDVAVGVEVEAGAGWRFGDRWSMSILARYNNFLSSYSLRGATDVQGKTEFPIEDVSVNLALAYHFR